MNTLFTIGHSNHELASLLELLRQHGVKAVADVRSHPYSGRLPQFNKPVLEKACKTNGLQYVFLGRELGARREEPCCYVVGQARYELVAKTAAFAEGLQRVLKGLSKYRVALLCAEKDPLTCHRTILVCRQLRGQGFEIQHIHADRNLESHEAAEERLMRLAGLEQPSLFAPHADQVEQAYDWQAARIAYRENIPTPEEELQSTGTQ